MTAAILCPGPSLCQTYPGYGGFDLVVGVNRVPTSYRSDVAAACDYPLLRDNAARFIGRPKVLTRQQTWDDLKGRTGLQLAMTTDALLSFVPAGIGFSLYTATSAIAFAARIGATEISVYGADMTGTAGFDAEDTGENRSDARWASEVVVFHKTFEWLASRGITAKRHLPGVKV